MIEIKMSGKCEGCPYADLEVWKLEYIHLTAETKNTWSIRCIHEDACERMKQAERVEE